MDTNRFDCWSSSLAGPERHTLPMPSSHLDAIARAMGAATSRRRVLGAMLGALVAPRFFASGAVAKQEATCPGPDCPCPCTAPLPFPRLGRWAVRVPARRGGVIR